MKEFVAAVAVTFCASSAFAFTVSVTETSHVIKWYNNDPTFPLQIDADGPAKKAGGTTLADVNGAINNAIASWNNATCSNATLTISGTTNQTANVVFGSELVENLDYINRLVWIEDSSYDLGQNVLGVTSAIYYLDGTVVEADVALNGYDRSWQVFPSGATPGSATSDPVDVESVVVHELGHLLGLAHVLSGASTTDPPTMAPVVDPRLRTRDPSQDDINGLCFLYPTTTYICDSKSECPNFILSNGASDGTNEEYLETLTSECASSSCTNIETVPCGSGNLGERCCTDNCNGNLQCYPLSQQTSDMAYCVSTCTSSNDCPDGFSCEGLGSSSTGICITQSVTNCTCDTNNACTSTCACDTDCENGGSVAVGNNDGGCAQVGGFWAALACIALMTRRVRLL